MNDVPAWLQGLGALAAVAIALGGAFEARVAAAKRSAHSRIDSEVAAVKGLIGAEEEARKREVDRIDDELAGIDQLRGAIGRLETTVSGAFEAVNGATKLVSEQVRGLADRFGDFKTAADKSDDELKHAVRNVQAQIQTISVQQARAERRHDER